jgi:hypothetical protein
MRLEGSAVPPSPVRSPLDALHRLSEAVLLERVDAPTLTSSSAASAS